MWDGQEDIMIDESYGKKLLQAVLELGGRIVLVRWFLDDRIWYIGEAARQR